MAEYSEQARIRAVKALSGYGTDSVPQYGLIILGNSGVGKSFLANILVGREVFLHEFSARSVTHTTEYFEIEIGDQKLAIFNIPGLIEADQKRVDLNKKEIDKAFAHRPNSLIIYVFGQQGGRIREEDIVAFNAINAAYPFRYQSLVLVINGLPIRRPSNYEGTTIVLLQQLLAGVRINYSNVCFLDLINENNPNEKQYLKERLLRVVVEFTPTKHEKHCEIETVVDKLNKEKKKIEKQRAKFDEELAKYARQIENSQRLLNQTIANHQTEIESFQRALQRQEQRFEEERRNHEAQLQEIRTEANQAKLNYQWLVNDNRATREEVQSSKKAYETLKQSYNTLAAKPPPPPPSSQHTKRGGRCTIA